MKKSFLLTITALLCVLVPSISQQIVTGKVLDQRTKKPIAFTNIGILNSEIGTISNEDGSFSISVPISCSNDTVLFSMLGYGIRRVPVRLIDAGRPLTVLLPERATLLNQITISAKKQKNKTFQLGNKYSQGGNIYADSIAAGSAMALLIENKYPAYHADLMFPVFVEKALLKISKNTLHEFKIRIRFLEVDSTSHLPGKDLFDENIVVTSDIKSGWLTFDLSSYNFKIDRPSFFLTFEWILDDKDRLDLLNQYKDFKKLNPEKVTIDTMMVRGEKISYYNWNNFLAGTSFGVSPIQFSLNNYQCYYRNNSFGIWKRAAMILTAQLFVRNQPVANEKTITPKTVNELTEGIPCTDQSDVCKAIALCNNFINAGTVNGMQLTVSVKNKTVLSKGFGFSDIGNDKLVTTQTRFRIGSISKAVTSAALIKLMSEKKLDLDVPVQQYVHSYPKKKYTVTTRQLAGHLGGIRHYRENDLFQTKHYNNCVESLSIFSADSLLFKPGTKYNYSSYGWNLIGAVIEQVSNQDYLHYMADAIWIPLKMNQTYGDVSDSVMTDKSKFYFVTGEEASPYDLSYKYPSGGLVSTTEDLVRFGNELLYGTYFDKALLKQLFQTQYTSNQQATNYGLGWNVVKDDNGHTVWYHAGNLAEGSGYLLLYPDDDIVIAY